MTPSISSTLLRKLGIVGLSLALAAAVLLIQCHDAKPKRQSFATGKFHFPPGFYSVPASIDDSTLLCFSASRDSLLILHGDESTDVYVMVKSETLDDSLHINAGRIPDKEYELKDQLDGSVRVKLKKKEDSL